jgi:hypothetical protein
VSTSSVDIKTVIQNLNHATPLPPANNSGYQQPLIFSQERSLPTEEKKEISNKEFLEVDSLESFAGTPNAEYTLNKTNSPGIPGITKISLHKHTDTESSSSSTQQNALIIYSIKIYIDDKSPHIINYLVKNPIFQIWKGNVSKSMFSLNENVAEVKGLKHDQFISTLGKLMIPDEFIQELGSMVRTHSNLYNPQTPTDDTNDIHEIATPPTPLLTPVEQEEGEESIIKQKPTPSFQ